ncbi:MAG: 4'-phosphopantetheinyl transferase family protein [Opitutaceae bacterium]
MERWAPILSAGERERAARLHFEVDARRQAAGRGALRLLLGGYLGLPPEAVRFAAGPNGKPELASPKAPGGSAGRPIEFNLSHSGEWALAAFATGTAVGVDLERHRELEMALVAGRVFRGEELEAWLGLPAPERRAAFFELWTLKEAYLKGTGRGLSQDPRTFGLRRDPGGRFRLVRDESDPRAPRIWSFLPFPFAPGYSAAVACAGPARSIRTYTFEPRSF